MSKPHPATWLVAAMLPWLAHAQTLAHRNWQGSGMTADPWWRRAVFYRIQPENFQDSTGSGKGDLKGIAERMPYLRSLGIDAIVLEPPFDQTDAAGFDALLSAASQSRLRVVVGVTNDPADHPAAAGRAWLARGVAGIELEASSAFAASSGDTLAALRAAARSFPGERVVMLKSEASAPAPSVSPDLLAVDIDAVARRDNAPTAITASLRKSLLALQALPPTPAPMLLSDDAVRSASIFAPTSQAADKARTLGLNAAMAALLLTAQPGAVTLLYGQELGLEDANPSLPMQWTPTNLTPPSWKPEDNRSEEEAEDAAAHPALPPPQPRYDPGVYGAFHPYVPPKKSGGPPAFDPNSLRGFSARSTATITAGAPAPFSANPSPFVAAGIDATRSVAIEERDPQSLLSFYRRLIALHQDDPVLRSGALRVFDHDADHALVWVRLPPPGIATARATIAVCNLGDTPLTLSLDDALRSLHLRPGALRRLASMPSSIFASTSHIALPPHGVYLGELYR